MPRLKEKPPAWLLPMPQLLGSHMECAEDPEVPRGKTGAAASETTQQAEALMEDRDFYALAAMVAVLSACVLLQSAVTRKLRADVDFLTVVSSKNLGVNHSG